MNTVYLAPGSNLGNSKAYLEKTVELLSKEINRIKKAELFTSKAVGYTEQPDFLNTVIVGETELEPQELLKFVKKVEQEVGRIFRFRWGPREIDVDIIFYNSLIFKTENLEIPHPRMHERDFVLVPLVQLDKTLMHPIFRKTVEQLLAELPSEKKAILRQQNT